MKFKITTNHTASFTYYIEAEDHVSASRIAREQQNRNASQLHQAIQDIPADSKETGIVMTFNLEALDE